MGGHDHHADCQVFPSKTLGRQFQREWDGSDERHFLAPIPVPLAFPYLGAFSGCSSGYYVSSVR